MSRAAHPHLRARAGDPSIAALADRARAGSLPAFAELVRRLEGRLFNFLLRRTRSVADAEDLTQESFVRAWQRIEQYDPRWQFTTWLFTIGNRLAIAHHRRNGRVALALGASEPPGDHEDDPARLVADREQASLLWDAADRVLSVGQRTALWLRYGEELPIRDIARIMGKTQVAVRVTLFRARETLAASVRAAEKRPHATVGHGQEELKEQLAGDLAC